MDVDALIRDLDGKKKKPKFIGSSNSSSEPLYRKGYLGEVQNLSLNTYDSFWGLGLAQRTVEPQYVLQKKPVKTSKDATLLSPPIVETRVVVNAN